MIFRSLDSRGMTLMELMCSLAISSILFTGIAESFFSTSRRSWDHKVVTTTNEQASALLDIMTWDLRMLGSGMPLGQASFSSSNVALGDAPVPLLTSSSGSSITFRLNQTGRHTVLTSSYSPSTTSLSFNVLDASDFQNGDVVYISDMTRGGAQGFKGTITGVSGNSVTVSSSYLSSTGASFTAGSTVNEVSTINYYSEADLGGIIRVNGASSQKLLPNCEFSLIYYDQAGAVLTPPLNVSTIENSLASLKLTVNVRSQQLLRNGANYTKTAEKRIALRNLNYNR